ncbi:hypothetical protein THIOSC13_540001 [uncultured Thiomicrorhabdus sp.]
MAWDGRYSIIGKEGMDILPGGFTMSHALGSPKPWMKKFIRSSLRGNGPTMPDKHYWNYTSSPIKLFSSRYVKNKKISIKIASLAGKFIK